MPATIGEEPVAYDAPGLMDCRRALRNHLRLHPMPTPGALVIGYSGGPDSFALLAAACADHSGVHALIIDHGLHPDHRGISEHAAAQAARLGATSSIIDVSEALRHAQATGASEEAAARAARYAAFAAHTTDIFIAHTADDHAETLLIGALRGHTTGLRPASYRNGLRIHRPLLDVRRAATHRVVEEVGPAWVFHDPTNVDAAYARGALRNTVMPVLHTAAGHDPVPALAAAATEAAQARELVAELARPHSAGKHIDIAVVAGLPTIVRHRVIHDWLIGHGAQPGRDTVGRIDALITNWRGQGPVAIRGRGTPAQRTRLAVARIRGKLEITSSPPSPTT